MKCTAQVHIEDVAANLEEIRDTANQIVFPVVPDGHADHIRYSFGMASQAVET
jgi:LmbE family N-acetylglucosaminyl deacetylase